MVRSHGCRVWRGARITFETALSLIWFELDLNLMEGECKVGQAVSYCSDGVIALSCLPESLPAANSWLNERIFVQKYIKKRSCLRWKTDTICAGFPLPGFLLAANKSMTFLLLNRANIHFSLKWLWSSYNSTFECSSSWEESFKTSVRSGISLVLFMFGLLLLVRLHFF